MRETEKKNGHELFMNASMKKRQSGGGGVVAAEDAVPIMHPSLPPLSTFFPTTFLLIRPLAGKTIDYCKLSGAKCKTVLLNITSQIDDARRANISIHSHTTSSQELSF